MRVQLSDLLVPVRRKRRMPIRDGCFALILAGGNDSNLNLVSCETWRNEDVLHATLLHIVGCQYPKSLFTIGARGGEYDALALLALRRVNKMRLPGRRPLHFADWSKKRRHLRGRSF